MIRAFLALDAHELMTGTVKVDEDRVHFISTSPVQTQWIGPGTEGYIEIKGAVQRVVLEEVQEVPEEERSAVLIVRLQKSA